MARLYAHFRGLCRLLQQRFRQARLETAATAALGLHCLHQDLLQLRVERDQLKFISIPEYLMDNSTSQRGANGIGQFVGVGIARILVTQRFQPLG